MRVVALTNKLTSLLLQTPGAVNPDVMITVTDAADELHHVDIVSLSIEQDHDTEEMFIRIAAKTPLVLYPLDPNESTSFT